MTGYYANYYVADVGKVSLKFRLWVRSHSSREIFSDFSRIVSPQADFAEAISCIDRCLLCLARNITGGSARIHSREMVIF